ncbi:MAG: hypothetical protein KJS92_02200, partial [Bacteroidetes bacterium]|nr:hypothetical protein [Bacteroidota bacterium]
KTGQAVMLDLHDVFMQSIQQEVCRARELLQARYPSMNIAVDRGLWNEPVDYQQYPNKLGRIVLLLHDTEVGTPLEWLKERGLKGKAALWLMSWRNPLDVFQQKKLLGYSLKEVKKNNPPFDFKKDELALRQLLPQHILEASEGPHPDFGLLCWKFNGALPSSLEKVLRDTLRKAPVVITHLLPDIRQ